MPLSGESARGAGPERVIGRIGKGQQFGGGADPADTIRHKDTEGFDNGVGVSAECDGPGGGVGEARSGGEVDEIEAALGRD